MLTKILGVHLALEKVIGISSTAEVTWRQCEWEEKFFIDVSLNGGGNQRLYAGTRKELDDARNQIIEAQKPCERVAEADTKAKTEIACTGISAQWCPVHGDCTCPDKEDLNHENCQLHSRDSTHGE